MAISHPAAQRGAWDLQGPLSKPLLPAQPFQAPCPACPLPASSPAALLLVVPQRAATAQPRQRSHCPCPEMQPARDWLLPSWVLVTSPTCTGGTLLVPVLHSVWAPGEFGHRPWATIRLPGQASGPPKPRGCCSRRHHPAGTGMGPAAAVPPGRGAAMPSSTAALSSSASDPQPHSPRARSSSVEPG